MNSMPYITSLQHKSNQDMTFDHLKATSVNMRHNAHRPVKSVEQWNFYFILSKGHGSINFDDSNYLDVSWAIVLSFDHSQTFMLTVP